MRVARRSACSKLAWSMKNALAALLVFSWTATFAGEPPTALRDFLATEYASLEALYKHLHAHPELSFQEEKTAARIAEELRAAGYAVTEKVGGHGVVGILTNGPGPTILLRADLDGLPVKEQTGLPYASRATGVEATGEQVHVMHACGHDAHMAVIIGTARFLARNTNLFNGTLVVIGQPAEERGGGARAMLKDGLFEKFPKPDYCLALHVDSSLSAGKVGYVPGYFMANVDSIDLTIRGVGGHGAYPHGTRDPIVLAAQTIMALQTLVSRENRPIDPAVLTVGSIHGGTKHNIIPDEVKMQLTLRSYSESVRTNMIAAIRRMTRGLAIAAGMPEDRMPIVNVDEKEYTPATFNDPALTARWVSALESWLGAEALEKMEPVMGGEDFGMYGRTAAKIPVCMLRLGSVPAKNFKSGEPLPTTHSPFYYPDPEPTLKTGVTALAAAVLELLKKE
jgi:amidohydrolase